MDLNALGRLSLVIGGLMIVVGGFLVLASRVPVLKELGHLPGDIHLKGQNFSCFFPVVSMIVLSILLTIVLNVVLRLFTR